MAQDFPRKGRKTRAFGGREASRERDGAPKIVCRRNSFLEKTVEKVYGRSP